MRPLAKGLLFGDDVLGYGTTVGGAGLVRARGGHNGEEQDDRDDENTFFHLGVILVDYYFCSVNRAGESL